MARLSPSHGAGPMFRSAPGPSSIRTYSSLSGAGAHGGDAVCAQPGSVRAASRGP